MTSPTVDIEVAFTTDPRTRPGAMDWTNISDDNPVFGSLTTERGLDMKSALIEAGVARWKQDNSNRELDPSNTGSTYSPNVKPRKRVRISINDGTGAVEIFTGFIERWPIQWETNAGTVSISASDLLSLIADEVLPPSVIQYAIEQASPTSYWPLSETIGTRADDITGPSDGTYTNGVQYGDPATPYEPGGAARFIGGGVGSGRVRVDQLPTASTQSVIMFVRIPAPGLDVSPFIWTHSEPGGSHLETSAGVFFGPLDPGTGTGSFFVGINDGSTWGYVEYGDTDLFDGQAHMIGFTLDASSEEVVAYIDGKPVDEAAGYWPSMTWTAATSAAVTAYIGNANSALTSDVFIGHTAYWAGTILTDAEVADIWTAATQAWSGDTTGERLERVLDILGIDDADRNVATGVEVCGPTILGEQNAVEYLRKIAATENGPLFVSADGKITFPGKLANDPTIAEIFDDDETPGDIPWSALSIDYSLDRVINTAKVQREGGNTQSATDSDSIDDYGVLDGGLGVVQTLHRSPSGARSLATRLVVRNHEPKVIIDDLTIDATDDDAPFGTMTTLDIGTAVTVRGTPPGGGSAIAQNCYIERITHTLDDSRRWDVGYGLAEYVTLPTFAFGTAGRGWDEAVWSEP